MTLTFYRQFGSSVLMNDGLPAALGEVFRLPKGLVLVCAPTGSGKTTAVYQALLDARGKGSQVLLNFDGRAGSHALGESAELLDPLKSAGVSVLTMRELRSAAPESHHHDG